MRIAWRTADSAALVVDGVFARADDRRVEFHSTRGLTDADVADVLAAIEPGVTRLLARRGFGNGDDGDRPDTFHEATPVLAGLAAASVQGVVALGRAPGRRPCWLGDAPEDMTEPAHGACHARWQGFDFHAGLLVPAGQRDRLERVCRHALQPGDQGAAVTSVLTARCCCNSATRGRTARRPGV